MSHVIYIAYEDKTSTSQLMTTLTRGGLGQKEGYSYKYVNNGAQARCDLLGMEDASLEYCAVVLGWKLGQDSQGKDRRNFGNVIAYDLRERYPTLPVVVRTLIADDEIFGAQKRALGREKIFCCTPSNDDQIVAYLRQQFKK